MHENVLSEAKLTDIIDVKTLQKIQDSFAKATGMAALTVDLGGLEAAKTKHPAVYYCHGGLMDFAAPIFIGDKQIGSMIGLQVLPQPPEENKFRIIAKELGIDESQYINALSKIKVVPKNSIEASAELLFIMANTLSTIGHQKYITQNLANNLYNISESIFEDISEIETYSKKVTQTNTSLITSFDTLLESANSSTNEVEEIDQVVKYIDAVAKQTNLLGLNAYIEASKALEYGAGLVLLQKK